MNKYHAIGIHAHGKYFPSKGEGRRAANLILMEKAGEIRDLKLHPSVELLPGLNWKLDSSYIEKGKEDTIYEDYKGVMTGEVRIKTAVWKYLGPGTLRFVGSRGERFFLLKEVTPLGLDCLICDLKNKK